MSLRTRKVTLTSVAIATVIALFQSCNHYNVKKQIKEKEESSSIIRIEKIEQDDIFTPTDNTSLEELNSKISQK